MRRPDTVVISYHREIRQLTIGFLQKPVRGIDTHPLNAKILKGDQEKYS
jgi:hypothetical protein